VAARIEDLVWLEANDNVTDLTVTLPGDPTFTLAGKQLRLFVKTSAADLDTAALLSITTPDARATVTPPDKATVTPGPTGTPPPGIYAWHLDVLNGTSKTTALYGYLTVVDL